MGIRATIDDRERQALDDLRGEIVRRIEPVLLAAGVDAHEVTCAIHGDPARLTVVLKGPAEASSVEQAIGVRVLDAVRAGGRTLGAVSVRCRFGTKVPRTDDRRPC